jgi:macrodomain Ter protein organizer (MatP/YcbG family)
MEKRITLRLPQQMFNSLEKEARQTGMTISDAIRDRIKHSMDFESLTHEVQRLRKDLDYFIDKDKRAEQAEARVM